MLPQALPNLQPIRKKKILMMMEEIKNVSRMNRVEAKREKTLKVMVAMTMTATAVVAMMMAETTKQSNE